MAFRENRFQQLSFLDSSILLTEREQKALKQSWAGIFAEEIFPKIDESHFKVLYSGKASRPNSPVNVIVGALYLKELFDLTDEELLENLMLDLRYQYALHTTSFSEQPLSLKTLYRFRKRCADYEALNGINLYQDCVKEFKETAARMKERSSSVCLTDDGLAEDNIRLFGRMEILYTAAEKMACRLFSEKFTEKKDEFPEMLLHYTEKNDFYYMISRTRDDELMEKVGKILKEADRIFSLCGPEEEEWPEYQLLVRTLAEQTVLENGSRSLRS